MSIPNYWKLKLWINHTSGQGFSESYNLNSPNRSGAKSDATIILNNRALLLPANAAIVHVAISNVDATRDSMLPETYLQDPMLLDTELTDVEDTNRVEDGYLFDFCTANGRHSLKLFRCLRDTWIEANAPTVALGALVPPGSFVTPAAGFTAGDALTQFVSAVAYYTQHIRPIAGEPVTFDNTAWTSVTRVGVGGRDCGPGYSFSRGRQRNMV